MIPRPARNFNPGDLEGGDHWQGLMPFERMTDAQRHERFATFQSAEWGFRALVVLLRNYKLLYGLDTVRKIINRFAPPSENNTERYMNFVSLRLGVGPDDKIDVTNPDTMFKLAKSVAIDETGSWEPYWHDSQLAKGMQLAGFHQTEDLAA
jgi:hypothetical protein